ncbi:hypothetical protein Tco_0839748 [Tanacetum coccineum]|uniref:Uncharacterized protein n=1 Tax=Tanacetum coccineum TaxID=301880 RepID=A0ABQ5ARI1_9ASTR
MHNNIMAAGLKDQPPMLATRRYAQWRSCFLCYIDTKTNGDALRKCILEGPYKPTTVTVPAVAATDDSLVVPQHTIVETILNIMFISASPDYVLASPGKTYSSSSNDSFGLVPIASPTLSLFHDDPFMKELFPLKKRGRDRSSSSTSALPQDFEKGESSRKTSLEHHKVQIEEILNHLDELSLDRIEHLEDKIEGLGNGQNKSLKISKMPPKRMSTSEAPSMTQTAIQKLVAHSVSTALEAQAANMANTNNTTRPREAPI